MRLLEWCVKVADVSFDVQFEELGIPERTLLLKAFDYDVDSEGFILDPKGSRIRSDEDPRKYMRIEEAMITSSARGTLEVLDGTPTSISKFIRERAEGI